MTKRIHKRPSRGYTLIEIVIVLAIAGLLMVMVLLTVGQAQKNRRDFQRKSDLAQLIAAVNQYGSNNQGTYPANQMQINAIEAAALANNKDPMTGQPYPITFRDITYAHNQPDVGRGPGVPPPGTIYYQQGHWCADPANTTDPIEGNEVSTKFVAWIGLESGGYYCLDSGQ